MRTLAWQFVCHTRGHPLATAGPAALRAGGDLSSSANRGYLFPPTPVCMGMVEVALVDQGGISSGIGGIKIWYYREDFVG